MKDREASCGLTIGCRILRNKASV